MPIRRSISQIRANVRSQVARLESRARQAIRDNQRRVDSRVQAMTCGGARPLTRAQIQQLARESASYIRNRMK